MRPPSQLLETALGAAEPRATDCPKVTVLEVPAMGSLCGVQILHTTGTGLSVLAGQVDAVHSMRWVVTLGLRFVYMVRVYLLQGWHIVTYALRIYHLNRFIAFLSSTVDPSLMEDADDGPSLPSKQNEHFQPFIRRLPEFKRWHALPRASWWPWSAPSLRQSASRCSGPSESCTSSCPSVSQRRGRLST